MSPKPIRPKSTSTEPVAADVKANLPDTTEPTYQEGAAAYHAGTHIDDNPYPKEVGHGRERKLWFCGYLDQRHAKWNGVGDATNVPTPVSADDPCPAAG